MAKPTRKIGDWLGFRQIPDFTKARWLGGLISVTGSLILITFVALVFWEFFLALTGLAGFADAESQSAAIRNIGLVVAAMIGVPFVIWRTAVAQKQVDTAQESLFNDKINAASEDLHAMRQIWKDGENIWEDDIVRRNAAIDRLEGLTNERPDIAPRISRLLCVYVRELSKVFPAEEAPEGATRETLRVWVHDLNIIRTDAEKAVQVLGRLKDVPGVDALEISINLQEANLQKHNLSDLNFEDANFHGAAMQGTKMFGANLRSAFFYEARMQGAALQRAELQKAQLQEAEMAGSFLTGANMQNASFQMADLHDASMILANVKYADFQFANLQQAKLFSSQMQCTDFSHSKLQGATLYEACLQGAYFHRTKLDKDTSLEGAQLRGVAINDVDLSCLEIQQHQIDSVFYDGSVTFPSERQRNDNWSKIKELWDFDKQLVDWQKSIGFDPDDPTTWDDPQP
ncbi:pentapeptide repeat-containing protein [Rhodobacteraceae bacterium M382]|nr:pentapeptide repeat-containing protein [Rhodobacteraceae bacterium M382]